MEVEASLAISNNKIALLQQDVVSRAELLAEEKNTSRELQDGLNERNTRLGQLNSELEQVSARVAELKQLAESSERELEVTRSAMARMQKQIFELEPRAARVEGLEGEARERQHQLESIRIQMAGLQQTLTAKQEERTSSADARNDKGYALITLAESLNVAFHPITLRPSHRLRVDAQASADIFDDLRTLGASLDIEGALLTVTLENLSATQSIDIANRDIEACFPTALNVQIQRKFRRSEASATAESVNAASLQEYFGAFLEEQTATAEEAARLNAKVAALFARYDEVTRDA